MTTRGVILWTILAIIIVGLTFYQQRGVFEVKQEQLDAARDTIGSEMILLGRYVVGVRETLGSVGSGQTAVNQLVDEIDNKAISAKEHIATVSIIGEVQGPDVAIDRINDLLSPRRGQYQFNLSDEQILDLAYLHDVYSNEQAIRSIDDADAQRLINRYGWFGELALTWNEKDDDEMRQGVLADARMVAYMLLGVTMGGLGTAALGLILLIVGIVLIFQRNLRLQFASHAPEATADIYPLLEVFMIFLVSLMGISIFGELLASQFDVPLPGWLIWAVPAVVIWPLLRGATWTELRHCLGLHRGKGVFIEIGCGVIGYIAGLPLLVGAIVIVFFASKLTGDSSIHPRMQHMAEEPQIIGLMLLVVVWAPLVEEVFFRGALYHHMRRRFPAFVVILITAFIFAIIHPYTIIALPIIFALGITLGFIREWRGSLIACMTAHAIQNTFAFTVMYLTMT